MSYYTYIIHDRFSRLYLQQFSKSIFEFSKQECTPNFKQIKVIIMLSYYCYYDCFCNIFIFIFFHLNIPKDSTAKVTSLLLWAVGEGTVGLTKCVYVWQGFVTKNTGWSPIRDLVTPAGAYTQNTLVTEYKERATQNHFLTIL